jgi:apolipoprotein N-acyltransferase
MISKSIVHAKYDNLFVKRRLGVLLSFLLTVAAQPDWSPLACSLSAVFGYALLFYSIEGLNSKLKFIIGCVWMSLIQCVQQSWIMTPTYTGPIVYLALPLHALSYGLIFGWICSVLKKEFRSWQVLAFASSWIILESVRPWLFFGLGFAWNPIGLMLTANAYSLQFASVIGILGLSLWVVLTNLGLYCKKKWALGLMGVPYLFGFFWLNLHETATEEPQKLNVLVVQQAKSPWVAESRLWQDLMRLLEPWRKEKPDLIVLSEGGLPRDAQQRYIPVQAAASLLSPYLGYYHQAENPDAHMSNTHMMEAWMTGWPVKWIVGMSDDQGEKGYFNGAFLFSNEQPRQVYHKRVLLPFGEYLPFCFKWVRSFLPIDPGFKQGTSPVVFNGPVKMGISICYEETVSWLSYQQKKQGAQMLVGLTNDVWYPHSRLPISHFYHARVRAVELGLPMIRACNTGVSCVLDSLGKKIAELPYEGKACKAACAVLKAEVPLHPIPTIFSFYGEGPIWIWLIGTFSLGFILYLKKWTQRPRTLK